jgi:hypothetical protein
MEKKNKNKKEEKEKKRKEKRKSKKSMRRDESSEDQVKCKEGCQIVKDKPSIFPTMCNPATMTSSMPRVLFSFAFAHVHHSISSYT